MIKNVVVVVEFVEWFVSQIHGKGLPKRARSGQG